MRPKRLITRLAACGLVVAATATAAERKPELLDEAVEIEEALAAGPPAIRAEAGVYVLTASGYSLARASRNGFHCLVGRSQPEAFEPQCFDAEGSATLLEQELLRGELQMRGKSAEEVREAIQAAWDAGTLRAPSHPGINYMLSEKNRVPVGPNKVVPYGPHLMFYAPGKTDADIGGDRQGTQSPIFMINAGLPSGYVIVPMFHYEREGG
jgi:hypothetical protein